MTWLTANTVLVPSGASNDHPGLFLSTLNGGYLQHCGTQVTSGIPAPGQWTSLDLKPLGVPANALAVDIAGLLIITDGTSTVDACLAVMFQSPGSGHDPIFSYRGQTIATIGAGGTRSSDTCVAPCINGVTEYSWVRGDTGTDPVEWPTGPIADYGDGSGGAAYLLNFDIQRVYLP